MKKLLLHTFVILISSLMLVETIGVYLTKDTCAPCGESEVTAQIIITDINLDSDSHHDCEAKEHDHEHDNCEGHNHCDHNELDHEHHQEYHFFKNISVFMSASTTPSFEAQSIRLIAPLVAILLPCTTTKQNYRYYNDHPKTQQEKTLSLLCTYLI